MSDVKIYTVMSDELSPPITGEAFCTDMVRASDYAALEQQLAAVVAENTGLKSNLMFWDADNPELPYEHPDEIAMECEIAYDDTFEVQVAARMPNRKYRVVIMTDDDCQTEQVVSEEIQTPATDAYLAEVRASAIPDGYKLVPEQMYLDAEDIQAICMQCGDGNKKGYGEFVDGIFWVGELSNDEGVIKYGLNVADANYPEEGSITVFEFAEPPFAAQLRQGAAL